MTTKQAVIVDHGSFTTKVGFEAALLPCETVRTIVGKPRHKGIMVGLKIKDCYVGNEAISKRGILRNRYCIERGIITNFEGMIEIWKHIFNETLKINPSEHPILLTESPINPKNNQQKTVEIMFETFNTNSIFMADNCVLSLYSIGKTNGFVLNSGYSITSFAPIYEGYTIKKCVDNSYLSGSHVSDYFKRILSKRGYSFITGAEIHIIRDIKETMGYCSMNYNIRYDTYGKTTEKLYELPDGQIVTVGDELCKCVEILFTPSLISNKQISYQHCVKSCIEKCDENIRNELCNNIVLSGGNTMFKDFDKRLKKELKNCIYRKTNVIKVKDPINASWIGGNILSSLAIFDDMLITKQEYNEYGTNVIHKKSINFENKLYNINISYKGSKYFNNIKTMTNYWIKLYFKKNFKGWIEDFNIIIWKYMGYYQKFVNNITNE